MMQRIPMEKNFLAAMLHGRRSRLAETGRLDELCLIHTVHELARVLYPDEPAASASELQRRMAAGLLDELSRLAGSTADDRRAFLPWLSVRFQIENVKVIARGRSTGTAPESLQQHLITLPRDLALDVPKLLAAESSAAFFARIPNPVLCRRLRAVDIPSGTFYLEAALDHAYLSELVFRAHGIAGDDRLPVLSAVRQEAGIFHLMLAVRGKFGYGLKPETLIGLHVRDGALTHDRFAAMLSAGDLEAVADLAFGRVIDVRPKTADPAALEILAWNRLLRLANKAFRQGHMGMGAVIGYTILRRVELANLITLCDGIRIGIAPGVLRARLIPRTVEEAAHV
ncbi:MAG: V-type ATPase subunit [Kiritimatiellales bacterium]